MKENEVVQIALFRYGILSEYISTNGKGYSTPSDFFRAAASKEYTHPTTGKPFKVSEATIRRWYNSYLSKGFDGLRPKVRTDAGKPRKLDEDVKEKISYYRENYPRIPATVIYEKLIEDGLICKGEISLSSITRYSNLLKATLKQTDKKDMRRYEREHINEVWCGDTCYGPKITVDGVKKRVYFIGLIDDASRMIVGIGVFFSDNTINLMSVLKAAVQKYGKAECLNFDNGKTYHNTQIEMLAGRIGSYINYNPPYTPTGKAKIERFWKTFKDHWMCTLHIEDFRDLESLNESLQKYVNEYNNTVHTSLHGMTPKERFFSESHLIHRLDEEKIELSFMLEEERKVSADNVIVIDKVEYEVPYRYGNQRIKIRYTPGDPDIYVVDRQTGELTKIHLLDKHQNSHEKRETFRFSEGEYE